MVRKKPLLAIVLLLSLSFMIHVAFASFPVTHKLYADRLNYWDNDIVNISTQGNGSIATIIFTKPTSFSFPATNNASCTDEDSDPHTITCTNANDAFWVRIQAPSSNIERTIVSYNITWNGTAGTSGNGISGPGNLIAMPENRTVRLIAGDEGGRRYFADSVFGEAPFYVGDDLTSFVAFVSLEPTVMSYLHPGTSGIRKGNETYAVCNLPTNFGTTVMESHLGSVFTNNTVVFHGKFITTSQNKPMWAKVRSTLTDGDVFQFNCSQIRYFCEECGGYVNVSTQQTLSLNVQNSTPFVWTSATPSTNIIGHGDGGKIDFELVFTNNESYEIDNALIEVFFPDTITAGRPRWVAVTKEIAALKEDRLLIEVAHWKPGQSVYVNATARFSFNNTEFDGNTVNLTARAIYYPEWERFISGGGRNPYRQEMSRRDLVTLDTGTGATITGLSTGGGDVMTLNCAQHAAPSYTVFCVSTARYPSNGSLSSGQTIEYNVLNQTLDVIKSGTATPGDYGSYYFNFSPSLTGNYLAYVNWSIDNEIYSASDAIYAEIFRLTESQNTTLYNISAKAEQLNSTLLAPENFGGNNLTNIRQRMTDLQQYLELLREESSENVFLVTDAIASLSSVTEKYEKGEIGASEAQSEMNMIAEKIKPVEDEVIANRLIQEKTEASGLNFLAERTLGSASREGQTFIYYVKAIGILVLAIFGAYLLEFDRKIIRFFKGGSGY